MYDFSAPSLLQQSGHIMVTKVQCLVQCCAGPSVWVHRVKMGGGNAL